MRLRRSCSRFSAPDPLLAGSNSIFGAAIGVPPLFLPLVWMCGRSPRHVKFCQYREPMPELPDVEICVEALRQRIVAERFERALIRGPFLLRSVVPPLDAAYGREVREVRRVGKRIAVGLDGDLWLVLHLMIAGRLHWRPPGARLGGRQNLAAFDFPHGSLTLTEAGTKRRASLHVFEGE